MNNPPPPPGRGRPYWALLALVGLLLLPAGTAMLILGGALLVSATVSLVRSRSARSARAEPLRTGEAMILGSERSGRELVLEDRQLAAHGLILGASGAGKSTTLLRILTDHIRRGRPVVAIDMKGSPSFAAILANAAAAAGRPFRMWTPDGPESWNPLQHGNATELKDKLIATERFTEPHYQRAAERYTQLALQVLHKVHPERPATLDEVVTFMDPRQLATLVPRLDAELGERVADYLSSLTPDQHSAVRGLGTRLAILSESHTGRFLEPHGSRPIDLRAALDGNEVVLFSLNSSIYGKLSAQLGTLVIQDLITASGHRLSDAAGAAMFRDPAAAAAPGLAQAIVGIDEFSALGGENVISLLARGRESNITVLLATQELADLDRAAPALRDQVVGVTALKIMHRQDVPASALAVAQMAGTTKIWEPTYQIGRGPFGRYDTSRGTRRLAEEFVVHPNQIKSLRTGEAVVITRVPTTRVSIVQVAPPGVGTVAPVAEARAPVAEPRAPVAEPRAPVAEPRAPVAEPRGAARAAAREAAPEPRATESPVAAQRSTPPPRTPTRAAERDGLSL